MKFGLSTQQYAIIEELVLKPFQKKKAQVYVFGSRARGTFHPFSDIDILYVSDPRNPITLLELSQINESLENSNLVIKVELVNEQDLASSYRDSVSQDKIRVI